MTRFPAYPTDILSRADALLSEKYPDGVVDPRFVEIACEAMIVQREIDALGLDKVIAGIENIPTRSTDVAIAQASQVEVLRICAKAIRGTE